MSILPQINLSREALEPYWLPFTPNRAFKANPRLMVGAKGMYYTTSDGRRILDGMAGLWCVNAGHGQERITQAIRDAAGQLDYVSSFQMSHPLAFKAAERIASIAPPGLDHVFFVNSGSEAVDTSLKIARAYHRMRGDGHRTRLVGRAKGYHGMGFGGLSVAGMGRHKRDFGPLLPDVSHLPHTYSREHQAFSRGQPEWGAHLADALENIADINDPSTIAAVVIEPVTGSGGVLPPPKGYLERLRAICDKYGILLIFDEVITGFGRLGAAFGSTVLGVTPDIITCAKGMSNGAVPMGGMIASTKVYEAFTQGPEVAIELMHGYTYSGHPLACAAAIATIDVYEEQDIFANCARVSQRFEEQAHSLKGEPYIVDVRNIGLLAAIDLAPKADAPGSRGAAVGAKCYDAGVLVRASGDTLVISPPLIISESEIDQIFETIRTALRALD